MCALPGQRQELRRAIAVAHLAARHLGDALAHRLAQGFAPGHHAARADAQAAGLGLVGQQRRRRGVGGQHAGLKVVERRHQFIDRLQQAEAARRRAQPGVDAAQPLEADHAREVPAGGRHQRRAVAGAHHVEGGEGGKQPAPAARRQAVAHGLQRVVHGHGVRVLHEDARLPAGARAFPHHVAVQVRLGGARRIGHEVAQLVQLQFGLGHPLVEAVHQLALGHRRHARQVGRAQAAVAQPLAVHRHGARGLEQAHQALLLALADQPRRGMAGGHHVQHGGLQAQGVEHRVHQRPGDDPACLHGRRSAKGYGMSVSCF